MPTVKLLLLLTMTSLAGCATVGPTDSYCAVAKPIWLNEGDRITAPTARQIYTHNETGARVCGWGR